MNAKMTRFNQAVIDELFRRVGFDGYDQDHVKKHPTDWYAQREWTVQEERSYKEWFIELHQKTFKSTKDHAQLDAGWFLLSYGWKAK